MLSASSGEFLRFFLFYWSPASSLVTAVSTAFPSSEARSHFRNSRRVMVEVIRSPRPFSNAASWSAAPMAADAPA